MARTIQLYIAYRAARGLLFWMPIFLLFFQQSLSLGEALWLEAVYYTCLLYTSDAADE